MHIADIINHKGDQVVTIDPDHTIADAVYLLREHGFGALVVSSDGKTLEGIISERDIVRHLAQEQEGTLRLKVEDLMTSEVHTCQAGDGIVEAMEAMTAGRFRHMPVVDDEGFLQAVISIGDVVKHRLSELETESVQLQEFITSGR